MSAVAPALQQGHAPEHALVDRPVVVPYVPAGQAVGEPDPVGQYEPAGLQSGKDACERCVFFAALFELTKWKQSRWSTRHCNNSRLSNCQNTYSSTCQ